MKARIEILLQDLRFASLGLRKSPAFTAVRSPVYHVGPLEAW